ncbi:DUF6531 domain-containing protein [Streptomyces sp. NBC_01304]|uniref:DUF6531 domain-containing protein n=1 Tax=Streptomyces sp. NBC_01304 TaxID=2903818 RepID=UPI002E126A76|nr:DUF6531 domain-containing protein [Streptomyces sp. NBC_01304]
MGYVLPGWLDEILDFIGINFPNVDEDDYREMADAMRELADAFDGHSAEAQAAVSRLLSSSEGWAVDALQDHWGKVKASHLDQLPDVARQFANAMDVVADIIYGMKIKAEVELGVLAASVGVSMGLAFVTGGLSALIGAAEIAAMREVVRRLVKEAAEQIVDQVISMVTEPVAAKLEEMVSDAVLDLANDAIQPATGGAAAMQLNSASGSSGGGPGGGTGTMRIDHAEYEKGAGDMGRLSERSLKNLTGPLDRAHNAHGRARGKDALTAPIDGIVDGAAKAFKKTVTAVIKHNGETVPKNMRDTSENHKRNERGVADDLDKIMKGRDGTAPGGPNQGGPNSPGGRGGTGGAAGSKPDLLNKALNDPRRHGVDLNKRRCETDPVDVATGQMVLPQTDIRLPGVLPLVLKRTHLSDYTFGTWFGRSWASTLDERIEVDVRNRAVWAREDGTLLVYDRLPTPQQPVVLPLEGPGIPLRRTSEFGAQEMEFATTDPHTGVTRYFARPHGTGWQLWLIAIEDRNGNQIDIHRDGNGMPMTVTHSGGYELRLTSDRELMRVTELALRTQDGPDEAVTVMTYAHDVGTGDLTEVTNSSGLPLRFTYDTEGRISSWSDRNGSAFHYTYDAAGRVIATVGPDGYLSSTFDYDAERHITRFTNSLGATTTYQFNSRLQVIAESDPLGRTTQQSHDARDRLLSRTDALGRTTTWTRDEHGNLLSVHRPDDSITTAAYNELNRRVEVVEADGSTWRYSYDHRGNRSASVDPAQAVTQFTHDEAGRLTAVTDPLGHTDVITCDAAGLPVATTNRLGAVTHYARDAFGRPVSITDPLGATTYLEWTVEGLPARRIEPDGSTESWTYDGEGNCTSHTDATGSVSQFEYTHFDLMSSRTGPDGARLEFEHDTELRLCKVVNPLGMTWNYEYDAAGNIVGETDFDDRTRTYAYDAANQLTGRTMPSGDTIRLERDLLGRIATKDAAGALTTYTYDRKGALVRAAGPNSVLAMERDSVGRILSESVNGRVLTRTYDALGQRTGRTTPTGVSSTWTLDAAGRRTQLTTSGHTVSFAHDDAGRELSRHIGEHLNLAYSYDELGRTTSQHVAGQDGQALQHRTYGYRADGLLSSVDDHLNGSQQFDLDAAGRVTAVHARGWTESYAYDDAGNQIQATWPSKLPGLEAHGARVYTGTRIQSAGNMRYEHDAAGRVTLRQKSRLSRKPDTWRYTWDPEDRLTSVITPDGTVWRYHYDPMGRRTAKQRLAADGESVVEQVDFTWDGNTLCEQTTRALDNPQAVTLTWDHRGLHPLAQTERKTANDLSQEVVDERFYAIVTDLIGTPTELVDTNGRIAWRSRNALWGATAWNRGATAYTPLRFPGQYFDPETGLNYNYFRHYDPETARYLSQDPLGLRPAPNPAAYVPNPHTWADPLGLAPTDDCPPEGQRGSLEEKKAQALRDAGVEGVEPFDMNDQVPATGPEYAGSKQLMRNHEPVVYREEWYENPETGDIVVFQDHWFGHREPGTPGHQPAHIHVRPYDNTRNGQIPGCEPHYYYDPE